MFAQESCPPHIRRGADSAPPLWFLCWRKASLQSVRNTKSVTEGAGKYFCTPARPLWGVESRPLQKSPPFLTFSFNASRVYSVSLARFKCDFVLFSPDNSPFSAHYVFLMQWPLTRGNCYHYTHTHTHTITQCRASPPRGNQKAPTCTTSIIQPQHPSPPFASKIRPPLLINFSCASSTSPIGLLLCSLPLNRWG